MSRSKWKGPYVSVKKINNLKKHQNDFLTASRSSEIIPKFLGITFNIHNGKRFVKVIVASGMVGHRFGEFVFTRARFTFKKKKIKKNK